MERGVRAARCSSLWAVQGVAVDVGDERAGFSSDDDAGRHVPRLERRTPRSRRRAPPATWQQSIAAEPSRRMPCTGARRNAAEHRELAVERRAAVVGEAGDEERVADRVAASLTRIGAPSRVAPSPSAAAFISPSAAL